MESNPFLSVIVGVIYLVVAVLWIWWFARRADPWLRERIGRLFGVTLKVGGKGMWTVAEKGQGCRGLLVEFLQPAFWIPAAILPLVGFVVLLMLLGQV